MGKITNWFTELKEQEPYYTDLVDKIVVGISEYGFNSNTLNIWISQELKGIETTYKAELKDDEN
ncbi:hypothetical protein ES708_21227 [subsurface metagenome]